MIPHIYKITLTLLAALCFILCSVAEESLPKTLLIKIKLCDFSRGEKWNFGSPGRLLAAKYMPEDIIIYSLVPKKYAYSLMSERSMIIKLKPCPDMIRLELDAEQLRGKRCLASIHFNTSDGVLKLKNKLLGENGKFIWNIPHDISRQKGKNITTKFKHPFYLKRIIIVNPDKGHMSIKLKELSGYIIPGEMNMVQVKIVSKNKFNVFTPNEKNITLNLKNTANIKVAFLLKLEINNLFGKSYVESKVFKIHPGKTLKWDTGFKPSVKGIYLVKYTISDRNMKILPHKGRQSFCVMNPAGPTEVGLKGFLLGICTHSYRWSKRDQDLEAKAIGLCGAKIARMTFPWRELQPKAGVWQWDRLDYIVSQYKKNGVYIQFILGFPPRWASTNPDSKKYHLHSPRLEPWEKYVKMLVERYKDRIKYWEVWNEPDLKSFYLDDSESYIKLLKSAYPIIKKIDPSIQVMTCGFATMLKHPNKTDDFHEKVISGAKGYFDIHAHHEHGGFKEFERMVKVLSKMRVKTKVTAPMYYNETAISSARNGQILQANTLVKKISYALGQGAVGYNWYNLRNDGFNSLNSEHNYGLLTHDFQPKAAYVAFNTLVNTFRGKKKIKKLNLNYRYRGWCFEKDNEQSCVLWKAEIDNYHSVILIKTDASSYVIRDIMGNDYKPAVISGAISFNPTNTPKYIVLKKAKSAPKVIGSLIKIPYLAPIVPNESGIIKLIFENPFSHKLQLGLNWDISELITPFNQLPTSLSLQAHEKRVFLIKYKAKSSQAINTADNRLMFSLKYGEQGKKIINEISFPVRLAVIIPAKRQNPGKADFVIDQKEKIVNLCETDPALIKNHWKGPTDLSMKVWMKLKKSDMLQIRFLVTDDIHNQKQNGSNIYNGDSIQLAMKFLDQKGSWEIGLAHKNNGKSEVFCWRRPNGMPDPAMSIKLTTRQLKGRVEYIADIPFKSLDVTEQQFKKGFFFSAIANDNDGDMREGWVAISTGIGHLKSIIAFPFIKFK